MKFSASRSVAILGSAVDRAVRSSADKKRDIASESMIIQNARPLFLKFGLVEAVTGSVVAVVASACADVVDDSPSLVAVFALVYCVSGTSTVDEDALLDKCAFSGTRTDDDKSASIADGVGTLVVVVEFILRLFSTP